MTSAQPGTAPDWLTGLASRASGLAVPPRMQAPPRGGRPSAVLLLFGETDGEPDLLIVQRSPHLRRHAGQPAFPGGAMEPADGGPVGAALREAAEEAGVDPAPLPPPAAGDDSEADERHVDPDTILADFDGVTAKLQDSVETLKSLRVRLAHVVETSVGSFRELDACHKELDAERAAREQDQEKMRQLEEQLTDRTQLLAEMKAKLGDFMSGLEPRI